MASSASSDENKAPEKFHLSIDKDDELTDERSNTIIHKTLQCPFCLKIELEPRFYCRNCVRNGNIVHSTRKFSGESLCEKQQKYLKIQARLKDYSVHCEQLMQEPKIYENLKSQIEQKKGEIEWLRSLITDKRADLQVRNKELEQLRKVNVDRQTQLPMYPRKVNELEDYVLDRTATIGSLREQKDALFERIKQKTREGVQQLVADIFPIAEVIPKDQKRPSVADIAAAAITATNEQTEESNTIAALAEAKNTSYIRGKWIFYSSGNNSKLQHRIVAPSVPASGDYSAYLDWLKKDEVNTETTYVTPNDVKAYHIVGALTYATQLTQLMSYFLNVRLPYSNLAYGDFCRRLNKEQFQRKVSRLNSNIMYLAYTQGVQLSLLNENHTLENILAILDLSKSDLGRCGCHEVANAPLMKSSCDSLLIGIETESESEDENSLDWEVPKITSLTHDAIDANVMPEAVQAPQQSNTAAEGLLRMATSGISSIFGGWRR